MSQLNLSKASNSLFLSKMIVLQSHVTDYDEVTEFTEFPCVQRNCESFLILELLPSLPYKGLIVYGTEGHPKVGKTLTTTTDVRSLFL